MNNLGLNTSSLFSVNSTYSFDRTEGLSAGFLTNIIDSTVSKGDSKSSKYCNASGVIWNPDSISRANMLRRVDNVNWSSVRESQVLVLNICHYCNMREV